MLFHICIFFSTDMSKRVESRSRKSISRLKKTTDLFRSRLIENFESFTTLYYTYIPQVILLHHEQPLPVYVMVKEHVTVLSDPVVMLLLDLPDPLRHVVLLPRVDVVLLGRDALGRGGDQLHLHFPKAAFARLQQLLLDVEVVLDLVELLERLCNN